MEKIVYLKFLPNDSTVFNAKLKVKRHRFWSKHFDLIMIRRWVSTTNNRMVGETIFFFVSHGQFEVGCSGRRPRTVIDGFRSSVAPEFFQAFSFPLEQTINDHHGQDDGADEPKHRFSVDVQLSFCREVLAKFVDYLRLGLTFLGLVIRQIPMDKKTFGD